MRAALVSLLVLGLAGLLLAVSAVPAPAADAIDSLEGGAKLEALIARVVQQQRSVRSLKADFVQRKRSELLLADLESSGVFIFRAPDKVRWDYRQPDLMVVVFADDTLTTFHPDQARAEQVKVSDSQRRFVRVLAGTQPLDDLIVHFSVTLADPGPGKPYRLTLRPVDKVIKKRLASVLLEVDRRLYLPVVVEYNEADGDSTRYEFRNLVLNPELGDASFRLELGADVRLQTIDASAGVG